MINAQMVEVEALRDRRTYQLVEGEIWAPATVFGHLRRFFH